MRESIEDPMRRMSEVGILQISYFARTAFRFRSGWLFWWSSKRMQMRILRNTRSLDNGPTLYVLSAYRGNP